MKSLDARTLCVPMFVCGSEWLWFLIQLVTHVTANNNKKFFGYTSHLVLRVEWISRNISRVAASTVPMLIIFSAELTDLKDSLKEISEIVLNLRNLGQKLRAGLNEARDNLTAAKENCNNDPPSVQARACDKIPAWDDLQAEADFNQVSNLCVKYPTILWSLTSAISFQTLGNKSPPQFQDFFSLSSCEGGL